MLGLCGADQTPHRRGGEVGDLLGPGRGHRTVGDDDQTPVLLARCEPFLQPGQHVGDDGLHDRRNIPVGVRGGYLEDGGVCRCFRRCGGEVLPVEVEEGVVGGSVELFGGDRAQGESVDAAQRSAGGVRQVQGDAPATVVGGDAGAQDG